MKYDCARPPCLPFYAEVFGSSDNKRAVDVVFLDFSKARKYVRKTALVTVVMRRPRFLALGEKEQNQGMNDDPGPL